MARDILFMLKEDFPDGGGLPYFCPDCATVTGVLSYFPKLRHSLDIRYVDFPAPRTEIVNLIGKEHQNCPVLILDKAPRWTLSGFLPGKSKGAASFLEPRPSQNFGRTFTVSRARTSGRPLAGPGLFTELDLSLMPLAIVFNTLIALKKIHTREFDDQTGRALADRILVRSFHIEKVR